MIPILYATISEGTVPNHYGLGALSDVLSCEVTEQRNGQYELSLAYAAQGIHAEDLLVNRFIKAKPNFTDNPQIFRIYHVGKVMNGRFTVKAQHISYDLSGKVITSGTASSCAGACSLLQTKAGNFTITTDKTVSASFSISAPSSVRSWFGGKAGSILDVFGTGEWKYDNYACSFLTARGQDRGVTIRYGKNLTQLSQEIDMSNLVTGIYPYYIDQDGNKTVGTKVTTGLTLDVPRDVAIDFSQDVDPESGTAITTQLANLANRYKNNNNLTVAVNSITLDFVQLKELTERVDLCDTVHIYFEALGITATAKCVSTTWDVVNERYTKTTFGDARTNIADTIAQSAKKLAETPSTSFMSEAIAHATELITGNLGGYVILHDSNGDGEPDEILIMNTADISTATQVWRWNKNGLGYSGTGYSGPYGTAITADGKIVADYILTGILNANLIKAGVIEDTSHNSTIDMTSGVAKLKNLYAKENFTLLGSTNNTKATLQHMGTDGSRLILYDNSGNALVDLWAHNSNGSVQLNNSSGYQIASIGSGGLTLADATGDIYARIMPDSLSISDANDKLRFQYASGGLTLNDASGGVMLKNAGENQRAKLWIAPTDAGVLNLADTTNTETITCGGDSGWVTCVHVNETSSRKVKENIEPIKDASKILELDAVSFDFKNKAWGTNQRGFIAEDVEKVLPNLVTPETETRPASLNYTGMIPYLQAVIKDQEKRIKALEDKLNERG